MKSAAAATLLLATLAPAAWAGGLYRWVDKNGAVHYTDTMPPEAAGARQDEYDSSGRVVRSTQANQTPAAIAAEEQRKREAEKQANYDRFLLDTYATVDQIQAARDERVDSIDKHLELAKKMRSQTQGTLDSLTARASEAHAKGQVLDQGLAHQIDAYKAALDTDQRSVDDIAKERQTVMDHYQSDMDRWQALHSQPKSGNP